MHSPCKYEAYNQYAITMTSPLKLNTPFRNLISKLIWVQWSGELLDHSNQWYTVWKVNHRRWYIRFWFSSCQNRFCAGIENVKSPSEKHVKLDEESLEGIIVTHRFRIQPAAYLARYARLARITYLSLLVAPAITNQVTAAWTFLNTWETKNGLVLPASSLKFRDSTSQRCTLVQSTVVWAVRLSKGNKRI